MPYCSSCGSYVPLEGLLKCSECGKTFCNKCAEEDGSIKELGVCSDCEEVYEGEEDYWGWK